MEDLVPIVNRISYDDYQLLFQRYFAYQEYYLGLIENQMVLRSMRDFEIISSCPTLVPMSLGIVVKSKRLTTP